MLGPDALSGSNAEETLRALDKMTNMPDKRRAAQPKTTARSPHGPPPAWLANSKGDMFDLD